jgi:hypothetical protein
MAILDISEKYSVEQVRQVVRMEVGSGLSEVLDVRKEDGHRLAFCLDGHFLPPVEDRLVDLRRQVMRQLV